MAFSLISAALGLAQFAPTIARWLGGENAQKAAEDVLGLARQITGEEDPQAMSALFSQNPEMLIEFQKAIIQLETDMELTNLRDRQDARARDIAIATMGQKNVRADIMVLCAAGGLICCLGSLVGYVDEMPGEAVGIISTIAGIFGACLKDAYAFEFGSSRGSKVKDSTMAALMERGADWP